MRRPFGYLTLLAVLLLPSAALGAEAPKTRADAAGDALPDGAVARFGSRRLAHGGSAINVVFAPDGKSLASCGNDGIVRLWQTATGKEIRRFEGHKGYVEGL